MIKLCDINQTAREKLPPAFRDKSGVGVHYVDAFIAPMNATLADAAATRCCSRSSANSRCWAAR